MPSGPYQCVGNSKDQLCKSDDMLIGSVTANEIPDLDGRVVDSDAARADPLTDGGGTDPTDCSADVAPIAWSKEDQFSTQRSLGLGRQRGLFEGSGDFLAISALRIATSPRTSSSCFHPSRQSSRNIAECSFVVVGHSDRRDSQSSSATFSASTRCASHQTRSSP